MATDQQSLEQRLDELLDVESFEPPESFVGAISHNRGRRATFEVPFF